MARLSCLLLATALALPGSGAAADAINLPDLGDASAAVISPAEERKLGEDFMRRARSSLAISDDPEVTTYVQNLGQKLVAHSDQPGMPFHFFVVADPSINAFAVPGGFIGVHTGLLLAAESEAELASVLAHEIAHITQRHIPRLLADQQRSMPAMAALLAAVLLAGRGDAAVALTGAAMAQRGINFTRSAEEEADRIGIRLLAEAGFDPRAMPAFFERMQALNRHNETNLPEFLRTHPVTTARIADSRGRAEQHPYRQVPDSLEFRLVRAKLRATAPGDPVEIARGFAANLAEGKSANLEAERYGYALALARARDYEGARREVARLRERDADNVYYRLLQAEIELGAGRTEQGLRYYAEAYRRDPTYYPLALNYARALVRSKRTREAEPILRAAIKQRPDDPVLYELLSQAAGANGKLAEAHQALAEHYYLRGDARGALEQLKLASRRAGDNFYLQSSIEARMQAIREEAAQLAERK
ncbi:MAG TPA: M48 family metalloprotease [Burkholderiales bacterium]